MTRLVAAFVALLVSSCATLPPASVTPGTPASAVTPPAPPPPARAEPLPRTAEPPPPPVNLSGFPLPYRQGYADGCASVSGAERKDAARWSADGNYRTGWQDGLWQCRKKK